MYDLLNGNMIVSNFIFLGDYKVERSSVCDFIRGF